MMRMRYCYSEVTTQRENNILVTYKNFENGEGRMTNRDNACAQIQLKNGGSPKMVLSLTLCLGCSNLDSNLVFLY